MPGGWADVGDIPSEAAVRETWEESGFEVAIKKVVGVFDANRDGGRPLELYHAFKIVFLGEVTGGEARSSDETLDVGFFGFDDLPPLSSNRTNERHLAEVQAHLKDPRRMAYFD
jgi:ADP-ribose pyrophosphatase YjhB (NUDIX family)